MRGGRLSVGRWLDRGRGQVASTDQVGEGVGQRRGQRRGQAASRDQVGKGEGQRRGKVAGRVLVGEGPEAGSAGAAFRRHAGGSCRAAGGNLPGEGVTVV